MMRKLFLSVFVSVLFCLLGIKGSASYAQCAVVGTDTSGTTVSITISCDFPVYIETGDELADLANYKTQKSAWIAAHPEDYDAVNALSDLYFEMHQADLDAMPQNKREAILARPELYHIITE